MNRCSFPVQQSIGPYSVLWIHHTECCMGLFGVLFQRFLKSRNHPNMPYIDEKKNIFQKTVTKLSVPVENIR